MERREEFEFYKSDEAMEPAGPPVRRSGTALSSHVPVRFSPHMIAVIRRLAGREGVTVSSWIRRAVGREIERFAPPSTVGSQVRLRHETPTAPTESKAAPIKRADLERTA